MPRQIIDTESGRPAYRRRVLTRWLIAIAVLVIAAFVAFKVWEARRAPLLNQAPVPLNRSNHAA